MQASHYSATPGLLQLLTSSIALRQSSDDRWNIVDIAKATKTKGL